MSTKKRLIRYGEIHEYYPIKFETEKTFSELCNTINRGNEKFKESYKEQIENTIKVCTKDLNNSIHEKIAKILNSNKEIVGESERVNTIVNTIEDAIKDAIKEFDVDKKEIKINVDGEDVKTYIDSFELEAIRKREEELVKELIYYDRIYNEEFISRQSRHLLLPTKGRLLNGEIVWINAILFVFANNMGVLKLEIPVKNIMTDFLKEDSLDGLFLVIENKWMEQFKDNIKFNEVHKCYLQYLNEEYNLEIYKNNADFKNIILVDFDHNPEKIDEISSEIKEELFRMICAPVPNKPYLSYCEKASEYIKENSIDMSGVKYIASETGGTLSIISKNIIDGVTNEYKQMECLEILEEDDIEKINENLAHGLCRNVEFAILMILLRKLNLARDIYSKKRNLKEVKKMNEEYNYNTVFINELQAYCYGSVSEQLEELSRMMRYYLKPELTLTTQNALNSILSNREEEKKEQLNKTISLVAIVFTLVLGLPSIREGIIIIRQAIPLWNYDIPYFSIDGSAIILWLLLNCILAIKFKTWHIFSKKQ